MSVADSVVQMAQLNNAWSAEQAQKQMDFQREMSNTAHQREIADLQASGLNPVLSAKLGGASTPSGASATGDTSWLSSYVQALKEFGEGAVSSAVSAAVSSSRSSPSPHSSSPRTVTPDQPTGTSAESNLVSDLSSIGGSLLYDFVKKYIGKETADKTRGVVENAVNAVKAISKSFKFEPTPADYADRASKSKSGTSVSPSGHSHSSGKF